MSLELPTSGVSDSCRCPSHSCYTGLDHYYLTCLQTRARYGLKPDTVCVFCWITFSYFHETDAQTTRKFRESLQVAPPSTAQCGPSCNPAARSTAGAHDPYFRAPEGGTARLQRKGTQHKEAAQTVPWKALAQAPGPAEAQVSPAKASAASW